MRKFKLGFLLTLLVGIVYILAVGTVAFAATAEVTIGDYVLEYDDSGSSPFEATIKDYTGSDVTVNIPETMTRGTDTFTIVAIGDNAFTDMWEIDTLTMPDTVTSIGYGAFASNYMSGELTSITLSSNLTTIGEAAFNDQIMLTSITIPASVTSIGDYSFGFCESLTEINVEVGNTSYMDDNGILYDAAQTVLIKCPEAYPNTPIIIPSSTVTLQETSVTNCTNVTSITLGSGVDTIGAKVFTDCDALQEILVDASNASFSSESGILFNGTKTTLVKCPEATTLTLYAIPNSVTYIHEEAFESCDNITDINMNNNVTNIGDGAFKYCNNLNSITLSGNLSAISDSCFYNCTSLASISIPNGITNIKSAAFMDCSSLTSIVIPEGVTAMEGYVFQDCSDMVEATLPVSVSSIGNDVFLDTHASFTIKGYDGTYAETYATTNSIPFTSIGTTSTPTPAPTVDPYASATPTATPNMTISFSGWSMYSKIVHKQPYYLGGTIESNMPFALVRVRIENASGSAEIDKSKVVNVTQYSMADMNDIVHMETLSLGNKTLYIYITNGLGEHEVYKADFTVVSSTTPTPKPTPTPAPTVNPYPTPSPTATPVPLTISFSGWSMYSKIIYKQPFYLGGKINSNMPFTLVRVKIVNDKGSAEIDKSQVVNVTEYSMSGMNSLVKMETLTLGKKKIYIKITNALGEHEVYKADFEVVKSSNSTTDDGGSSSGGSSGGSSSGSSGTTTSTASVSFSGWSMADSILEGTKYYMWGTISASEKMEKLSARIVNSAGTTKSEKTVSVNSKTYELGDKSGNLSTKISFSSLDPGRYDLILKATFAKGSKTVYKKSFTVVKKTNLGTIDTLTINKTLFSKGEEIKLDWEKCKNADSYELVFTLNGKQIKKEVIKDTSYNAAFDKSGSYSAFITAKNEDGTKTGNYVYFKVSDNSEYKPVTAITISSDNYSINITDTVKLTYSITPADASRKNIIWKSEDPDIASVDQSGYLTANRRGKTTITAVSPDGVTSNEYDITVVDSQLNMQRFANEDTVKLLELPEPEAKTTGAVALGQELTIDEIRISDENAQYWAHIKSGDKEGWVLYSLLSDILSNIAGANGANVSQATLPYPGGSYITCYSMLLNNLGKETSAIDVYKQNGYSTNINHEAIAKRNGLKYELIADNAMTVKEAGASLPEDLREKIISAYDKYPMGVIVNFVRTDGAAHAMLVAGYDSSTIYFLDPALRTDSSKAFEETVVFNRSISSYSMSTLK